MSLNESKKRELAKKIEEQRKTVWKGEAASKRRIRKRREYKKTGSVSEHQQEYSEDAQASETYRSVRDYNSARDETAAEQNQAQPQEPENDDLKKKIAEQRRATWQGEVTSRRRMKKKRKTAGPDSELQSKLPRLKIALLLILGLVFAIALGVAIGYLLASHDLIKI